MLLWIHGAGVAVEERLTHRDQIDYIKYTLETPNVKPWSIRSRHPTIVDEAFAQVKRDSLQYPIMRDLSPEQVKTLIKWQYQRSLLDNLCINLLPMLAEKRELSVIFQLPVRAATFASTHQFMYFTALCRVQFIFSR